MAFWKSESPVYGAFHLVHLSLLAVERISQ